MLKSVLLLGKIILIPPFQNKIFAGESNPIFKNETLRNSNVKFLCRLLHVESLMQSFSFHFSSLSSSHCSPLLVQIVSTPLSCRGAVGESFPLPYILYNKVYSPSFRLLLSVLHSFFLFFLKNLSHSFAGLRKSHTFALAKREHLLRAKLEDVFVALRRKSSLTDFHRQKLQYRLRACLIDMLRRVKEKNLSIPFAKVSNKKDYLIFTILRAASAEKTCFLCRVARENRRIFRQKNYTMKSLILAQDERQLQA